MQSIYRDIKRNSTGAASTAPMSKFFLSGFVLATALFSGCSGGSGQDDSGELHLDG